MTLDELLATDKLWSGNAPRLNGVPYRTQRKGLRVVGCQFSSEEGFCSTEVITNAYGNGYVNERPEKYVTEERWAEVVKEAKELECRT